MTESDGRTGDSPDHPATSAQVRKKSAPNSAVLSVSSLVLAIAGLALFWSVMVAAVSGVGVAESVVVIVAAAVGVVLGLAALVTGALARRRVRRGRAAKGGVALAGMVLGVLAVVMPAITLAGLVYQMYSDYEEFEHCVEGSGSGYPKYLCLKECPTLLNSLCRRKIGW